MRITHIYHSGFTLEATSCTLLFDWWRGELPEISCDLPLYVFVSHIHHDHYDPRIWELPERFSEVHYIVDTAVAPEAPDGLDVWAMAPGEKHQDALVDIQTLESNDEGLAFVVDVEGRRIYFAGDLNVWWWDRPLNENIASRNFCHSQLARVATRPFDIAFVPLDVRLANTGCDEGIRAVVEEVGARLIVPMHYGDDLAAAAAHLADPELAAYANLINFDDVIEVDRQAPECVALGDLVADQGRLSLTDAVVFACDICEQTGLLHAAGTAGLDISPTSVVVSAGRATLAHASTTEPTAEDAASSDAHQANESDTAKDICAIGQLLGYMLTGEDPTAAAYAESLVHTDIVPESMQSVITCACRPTSEACFHSIDELDHAIIAAELGKSLPVTRDESQADDTAEPLRRRGKIVEPYPKRGRKKRKEHPFISSALYAPAEVARGLRTCTSNAKRAAVVCALIASIVVIASILLAGIDGFQKMPGGWDVLCLVLAIEIALVGIALPMLEVCQFSLYAGRYVRERSGGMLAAIIVGHIVAAAAIATVVMLIGTSAYGTLPSFA